MLNYKIEITDEKNPLPVVVFDDPQYELTATFLLAEARTFGREIIEALDEVAAGRKKTGTFAGNVFSLEIAPDKTLIDDDISGEECEMDTRTLKKIAEEYWAAYKKIQA